jgi:hypothetical protein
MAGYGTWTNVTAAFNPNVRFAPVTRRAPSRRCSLNATAVTEQLRSIAIACESESSAMVRTPGDRPAGTAQNVELSHPVTFAAATSYVRGDEP